MPESTVHEPGLLQKEYDAIEEAKELEEALLSLEISREEDLVDIEDPATPLKDLINTANVYRLSALVLLYHAFPDLLIVRLSWRLNASVGANKLEEQRLQWLCDFAMHTLELLCENSATSGTRSIEQILLVVLAGELRMPSSFMGEHSAAAETSDAILDLGSRCNPWNETTTRDRVSEARSTVVKRLRSIQQILPYKSLELVEELILETWKLQDMGRPEEFWMDVMIENGWQFLLV
ncbi:hypothetical protein LTS07_006382 [Exophiala sideris]|uniref:Uncharacterized protein n=1 Tax=Exophiala sideris TaxID=1016849 RepID=A0ABR0J5N4_9EURO|nr:hypothetical protein LTS07_006382 [Exophiala sideris]KAK5057101.1 hypothetical protein LTR69_007739 [Exophiala sideris]KAK5181508.1 hypothetical protein LTR44_006303 [Eurotiomycetes sp. CCFEE 6388]